MINVYLLLARFAVVRLVVELLAGEVALERLVERLRFPDVQQQVLEVLKGGADVAALQAAHGGSQISAENLVQRRRFFGARVELGVVLEAVQVRLLHRLHQVAQELMRVLLPARD